MTSLSYVSDEYLLSQAGIDTEKFKLGKLCKRGHDWEGTEKTLKYSRNGSCVECRGVKQISAPPIDISESERLEMLEEAGVDTSKYKLRKLCKYGHDWNNTGLSLRTNDTITKRSVIPEIGSCVECQKLMYQPPGGSDQYNELLYSHGIDPAIVALGQLCKREHNWNNTGLSLRRKQASGLDRCLVCEGGSKSREGRNVGQSTKTLENRFYGKIDIRGEDECWPWKGSVNKKGYGTINVGRNGAKLGVENDTVMLAHRLAFLLANGYLDPDLMVLHSCDFPGCCNDRHLRQGTAAENSQDMASRDRSTHGENNFNAKFTNEIVLEMRLLRWVHNWSCTAIADKYDTTTGTISEITRGILWGRADGPICEADAIQWSNYDAV